jgi:hypothetical protein
MFVQNTLNNEAPSQTQISVTCKLRQPKLKVRQAPESTLRHRTADTTNSCYSPIFLLQLKHRFEIID